jgi:hypothetical protein
MGTPLPRVAIAAIMRAARCRSGSLWFGSWKACRYSSVAAGGADGPTQRSAAAPTLNPTSGPSAMAHSGKRAI